jgi:hypothetical protein
MIKIFKNQRAASKAMAEAFTSIAEEAVARRGRFTVALTGGSSPNTIDASGFSGTTTLSGPIAAMLPQPVTKVTLTPVDETTFLMEAEGQEEPSPAVFYEFEGDTPRFLHVGARAHPRT